MSILSKILSEDGFGEGGVQYKTGVAGFLLRDNKILLGERLKEHGKHQWQCPGGKHEKGETWLETAKREIFEETKLTVLDGTVLTTQFDYFERINTVYKTIFVCYTDVRGVAENTEPSKCAGWKWYALNNLPRPLFAINETTLSKLKQIL